MQAESLLTRPQEFTTWKIPRKEFIPNAPYNPYTIDESSRPMMGFENTKLPGMSMESFFGEENLSAPQSKIIPADKKFDGTATTIESMGFTVEEEDTLMNMETLFNDAFESEGTNDSKAKEGDTIIHIDFSALTPKEDRTKTFALFTEQKGKIAAAGAAIVCCPPAQHSGSQPAQAASRGTSFGGGSSEHKSGKHDHCSCGKDAEEGKTMCKDCLTLARKKAAAGELELAA